MKNSKSLVPVLLAALLLGACAQKDSEFAANYAKNAAGAGVVDGNEAQDAIESAAEKGLVLDIVDVQKTTANGHSTVTSTILVNKQQFQATSTHYGNASYGTFAMAEKSMAIDGLVVAYHAVCGNVACDPIYIAAEIYKDGAVQIQTGMRKVFDKTATPLKDRYQSFTPANAKFLIAGKNFAASDLSNKTYMVGYLNLAPDSSASTSTGLIK